MSDGSEWRDIDLAARRLAVERSDWQGHVTVPKGGRSRQLPMTQRLTAALKAARHLRGERVLCLADELPITRDRVIKAIRGAQRVAGIDQGGHILRHTFCSHLEMKGDCARGWGRSLQHQESGERSDAAHRSRAGIEGVPAERRCKGSGDEVPRLELDSGLRESNPSSSLGKPEHYHYAKPAISTAVRIVA